QCSFDAIRNHLGRDTDGLLLIGAAAAAECESITRLIQDITLQKLPPVVVISASDPAANARLACVESYVSKRLRWPEDAPMLRHLVLDRFGRGREFTGTRAETLEEVLGRRLLAQTPSLLPLADRIALAAAHDVTVLLTGETGTGKTFLARLMHETSPRKQ